MRPPATRLPWAGKAGAVPSPAFLAFWDWGGHGCQVLLWGWVASCRTGPVATVWGRGSSGLQQEGKGGSAPAGGVGLEASLPQLAVHTLLMHKGPL